MSVWLDDVCCVSVDFGVCMINRIADDVAIADCLFSVGGSNGDGVSALWLKEVQFVCKGVGFVRNSICEIIIFLFRRSR